ncbi:MAG: DUF362 domain-containing protein [Candidatus Omnitrophica bacterium]|nr:DUF362 domain-containing protein [Candidatus Omnitrophota bacterium]MBU4458079.1 DUF362 domain-containing protein [Candidatus Omnitrophota bacterium]
MKPSTIKSDVYFIKLKGPQARRPCLQKLLQEIDPFSEYKKDEFIPVKLTIGDSRCIYHLSPELVKLVVAEIKKKKAKPFLFDTNVIYKGKRLNAVDHLTLAQNKGFSHSRVGAPFIIADGLVGHDGKEHKLESEYIEKIKLPSFIGMVDSLVVLSHVTCHILSGFAGSLKNVAMGMVCKPTKQALHSSLKPHVIEQKCASCGLCIEICPANAIELTTPTAGVTHPRGGGGKAAIDQSKCIGCGECLCACKFDAIFINWGEDHDVFAKRMIDAAQFILSKFKNKLFVNLAFDVAKECDCISTKNEKIVCQDIGILASKDIVALDKATLDLINKDEDIIYKEKSQTTHKTMLEYAHKKGLGNLSYNLIEL